jgi:phosphonopyruvate decarboxylase
MIEAELFVDAARDRGFGLWSGVPCSYLTPFINYVIDAPGIRYVPAANEGDAVAIAAGSRLGGVPGIALFQNSGLGNAVNPLTSLTHTSRIPILIITTLRGEPGGPADEPQHALMGAITTSLLELMDIPWEYFPGEAEDVQPALDRALLHLNGSRSPYAFVMRKGGVSPYALRTGLEPRTLHDGTDASFTGPARESRRDLLRVIQTNVDPGRDAVVATTGFTGRELYACADRENQFYMVGSMGCASSLGLGLALAQSQRRVIVLDGDGAALMRLGAMATIGYQRPPNLVHILLDNEIHESTGGQGTVSHSIDLGAIAAACGYRQRHRVTTGEELQAALSVAEEGLRFIHAKVKPGTPDDLPRPAVAPADVAERFQAFLERTP